MDKALISILGGLSGMFGWGVSDFLANLGSDRLGHYKTLFWSQVAGATLVFIAILFFLPTFSIPWQLLLITLAAGIAYAVGYLLFYKGFELGNVSVVSAVINLQNIFVIAISYFLYKQTLTAFQIPALLLLLLGITLVSVNLKELKSGEVSLVKGVKETILATIAFGIFYWPVNEFLVERVHWLTIALLIKISALTFLFLFSLAQKKSLSLEKVSSKVKYVVIFTGIFEALGVLGTSVGLALGDAIIVAPVASALTIVTVSLAVIFLKEKLSHQQMLGIALTVSGIVLSAL